ncbi:hypothetical protein BKA56DRAFT_680310 [Ilyonectria sp. MPI-CAGE-AT-0026]|nr:hypothetical protein BKA56DRAFT_680310 [Ilyonectria sp. MPI-CAGE-AT-0026]
MPAHSIVDWLSSIPLHRTTHETPPLDVNVDAVRLRKRRRLNPPTPEPSTSNYTNDHLSAADGRKDNMSSYSPNTSPTKRFVPNNDDTPRPQRKRVQTPRSESSYSLSSSHSNRGGRQSPQKYLNLLECSDRGVCINELTALHHQPPALQDLLDTMEKISSGGGIVATSARGALSADDNFRWCRHTWHFSDEERDLVGPTPSPKAVLRILAAAAECSTNGHSEAGWNVLVHQRVLELALQSPDQEEFKHHINFLMSSTANILPEYVATATPLRKIDFCMYIDPAFDPSSAASTLQSVITNLRGTLPGAVLNHTDYRPLRGRPIALSIETKKTGEGWDGATLQLGVWQSAHWSFLRRLVEGHRRKKVAEEAAGGLALAEEAARSVQHAEQGAVEDPDGDTDSTETNSHGQVEPQEPEIDVQPYPLPDFIPGIIVQGHDWHLVITTTDGQQTQLWQKVTIGTTNTTKGIYQIVYALQILRQWAQDVYWPWLRALILAF